MTAKQGQSSGLEQKNKKEFDKTEIRKIILFPFVFFICPIFILIEFPYL